MLGWGKRRRKFRERGREEGMKPPIKFIVRKVILQTRSCLFRIKKPKYPQFGVLPKAQQLGNPEENAALHQLPVEGSAMAEGRDRSREMTFTHKDVWDLNSSKIKQHS